jgi:alkyl sulfatase BDS1-like metallo-beta-lactamase superfamily hydrolase
LNRDPAITYAFTIRRIAQVVAAMLALNAAACTDDRQSSIGDGVNPPSDDTIAQQRALRKSLPFDDQRDFDEQRRGFVAAPPYRRIIGDSGEVVWDIGQYDFLLTGEELDSIHPSLQRQATLNMTTSRT